MDIFEQRKAKPMLIAEMVDPFDDDNYIYELKLDGERCVAYLDTEKTLLLNKRDFILNPRFPELGSIHQAVKNKCILDGEVTVFVDGKPFFAEVQRRSILTNKLKIEIAIKQHPANFTAFDILYYDGKQVTDLPLIERKELLKKSVEENQRIAISRYIEGDGIALYKLTVEQKLEGVVAKRKGSPYLLGKRTKDWVKIKNLKDEDYVICGYRHKDRHMVTIVLGQYENDRLIYKGHVSFGKSQDAYNQLLQVPVIESAPLPVPKRNESVTWIRPELVCIVQYMPRESAKMPQQSVFKGLRDDKAPEECIAP